MTSIEWRQFSTVPARLSVLVPVLQSGGQDEVSRRDGRVTSGGLQPGLRHSPSLTSFEKIGYHCGLPAWIDLQFIVDARTLSIKPSSVSSCFLPVSPHGGASRVQAMGRVDVFLYGSGVAHGVPSGVLWVG
jgi:hypothetical protein